MAQEDGKVSEVPRWQLLFSGTLVGLTAARLKYTLHLPSTDPLNGGRPFYGTPSWLALKRL